MDRFAYDPPVVRSGAGAVAALGDELAAQGLDSALVVCGQTVGSTPAVVDPVREGLGDRLAGVFAETTPQKRLGTAIDALAAMRETGADALVGLGGGSSLDVATVASLLAATDRDHGTVGAELVETGTIGVDDTPAPLVAVPTTLAGAALSQAAGVTAHPDTCPVNRPASGGVSDPRLMPVASVADPELVATTPRGVLCASAMNGFDKAVETLYAANATPVTDATASRALSLLVDSLPALGSDPLAPDTLAPVVEGVLLAQYGVSRPDGTTLSLIHSFGHALTRTEPLQQGAAHAVVAPNALRYLFEAVDGRRDLLAAALGVDETRAPAAGVVAAVERVRDGLGLPSRLRDVDGPDPDAFTAVAEAVLADSFMANAPPGLDPTVTDIEAVLEAAY